MIQTAICLAILQLMVCLTHCFPEGHHFLVQSQHGDASHRQKRFTLDSQSCRRCINYGDWSSCSACYGGLAAVSSKRTTLQDHSATATGSDATYDVGLAPAAQKRSAFLACMCCVKGDRECCDTCAFPSYYGKRSYATTNHGTSGEKQCHKCCQPKYFDLRCCMKCTSGQNQL